MILIIVHHHFRPGGVRRVIELATPHLVAHWPERVRRVVLATGEAPDPAWLRTFRDHLGAPLRVVVEPVFGYASELGPGGRDLGKRVANGVLKLVRETRGHEGLIWAHNLGLGRNLFLSRELTFTCNCLRISLVVHHHDWWFENRWHHYAAMRERGFRKLDAVARATLAASSSVSHVAVNRADAAVLEKHFPGRAAWLPNPVEPPALPPAERVEAARAWLRARLGEDAPVWLLPCRLLRRKNIAEALLLTRWLRPEAWLVTTGGVSSVEEQAYADTLAAAAQTCGWRMRLGILHGNDSAAPCVSELMAASETVLLTSMQEGFGLPFLEAAAAQRPLVARTLPNIAPDLAEFGFKFPQCYREVRVDPSLFDWRRERQRQAWLFAEWKNLMPSAAVEFVGKPALLAGQAAPVPFSRLTLTAQLEVLAQPVEHSWERCVALNSFLKAWRERAGTGRLATTPWPRSAAKRLGGAAYAKRFLQAVPDPFVEWPPAAASQAAQDEFLRRKLRAENLYPLLWNSRT